MTIQDLQHYRQLIESSANPIITEDYDSRISNLADVVMQKAAAMPGKINKADLERMIRVGINWGLGSTKPEEVIKDVLAKLKGKIEIKKSMPGGPRTGAKTQAKQALKHLARYMSERFTWALGDVFPDGDPHDAWLQIANGVIKGHGDPRTQQAMFGNPDMDLWDIRNNTDPRSWLDWRDWMQVIVYPLVMQEFQKQHKTDPHGYLADVWDQHRADAEYDAKQSKQDPEQFLRDRGLAGPNPYR